MDIFDNTIDEIFSQLTFNNVGQWYLMAFFL